jgi:putative addiction module CopG family antidote
MEITIPKSLEALVRRKVEEGHYSTEDEVVAVALRLMQARNEVAEIRRARKDAIDRGYEDAATGKVIRLESDDQIDAFFAARQARTIRHPGSDVWAAGPSEQMARRGIRPNRSGDQPLTSRSC